FEWSKYMFKKIFLSLVMICISFLTGYATAQSYFLNKTTTSSAPASNDEAQGNTSNALSPNEFQNQTQQLQEKKNQALSDQLKQHLSKVPPTPPPSIPSPEAAPATPESTTPTTGQATSPEPNRAQTGTGTGTGTEPTANTNKPSAQAPQETSPSAA